MSESSSNGGSSPNDASTTDDEPTGPEASPEWTAEFVRTMPGTESLFTFLTILGIDEDGSTTKIALVTAFLTLVAAEREKPDLPTLPSSCTTESVLASKVLPHTTVLGTTSLATFLAQFDFGHEDTVEAGEFYRIFKNLCIEETRKNLMATTGVMGRIGRHLGKLSSA